MISAGILAGNRGRRTSRSVALAAVKATGDVRPLSGSASPQFILPAVAATGARASFSISASKSVTLTRAAATGAVAALTPTANPNVNLVAATATGAVRPLVAGGPQTVTLVRAAATGAAAAFSVSTGGSLTVEITFPSGVPTAATLVYDMSLGTNMGDYVAPTAGFTQHCVRARNVSLSNFWVDFRPDASGTRTEVVFFNGECDPTGLTVPTRYTRDLPGYTAVVKQGGSTLSTTAVPRHYWGQRWRWQSAARTVIRTAAQVFSDGLLPPMTSAAGRIAGYSGVIVPPVPPAQASYTTFMPPNTFSAATTVAAPASAGATSLTLTSAASPFTDHNQRLTLTQSNGVALTLVVTSTDGTNPITFDWPLEANVAAGTAVQVGSYKLGMQLAIDGGGERLEIGPVTEWQGDWLLRGTASSLAAFRAQAEMWAGDLNWCQNWDVQTGKPVDWSRNAACYAANSYSSPYGGYQTVRGLSNGFEWHEAEAHSYAMFYLPWCLTEDPYLVEAQQAMICWYIGWAILDRESVLPFLPGGTRRVCSYRQEIRTLGHGVRNLALAWRMSPTSAPSWLHPRSLYSQYSDDYSFVIDYFYRTPGHGAEANVHAIFRMLSNDGIYQAFEQAYALHGMGYATLFGMPTTTAPSWLTQLTWFFGMFDGLLNGTSGWNHQSPQPHDFQYIDPSSGSYVNINGCSTWTEFYNATVIGWPPIKVNNNPSPANQQGGSLQNANQMVAACAIAKSVGVPAALTCKTWLDTYIDFNWPIEGISFFAKDGFSGT